MPRTQIVLSDSESDDEGPDDQEPNQVASDEEESESDEEEIVYEDDEDPLDKLDRELAEKEPPRRARKRKRKRKDYSSDESRDTDDDDDDDDDGGGGGGGGGGDDDEYIPWQVLRQEYQDGERDEEPAGLTEHPEVHVPGWRNDGREWTQAQKDALWASIRVKAMNDGFYEKWGVVATERKLGGNTVRIVHRTNYGKRFKTALKKYPMGSYKLGLIPTMVELFEQEPWQPFFNQDDDPIPNPIFEDFEAALHFNNLEEQLLRPANDEEDGPLWCLCTQCSKKGLENITIMRHKLSGILVAVGGDCARHMVGAAELNEMLNYQLNGDLQHGRIVGQILGWW